jgi:Holliday junction DNA helicase RuvB
MNDKLNSDVNEAAPTSIRHIIGQGSVVDQVMVALDAAFTDGLPMPHAMLLGAPGLGKTTVAHVIASEMASECHEVLGQTIRNSADLNALLLAAKDRDIIHVDECHQLDRKFQTALYMALDQKRVLVNGDRTARLPEGIPLASFTLLLSTTDEFGLLQPLRDRMRLTLRFEFYSHDELVSVLRQAMASLGWSVDEAVLPQIAERARGTPRLALRLLQSARRVSRAAGETTITSEHLERACELEATDPLGLGPVERMYLDILAEGASRLNLIASRLGLPVRTVSNVTEPFLIRAGLVTKDDQSRRVLTAKGREHLLKS